LVPVIGFPLIVLGSGIRFSQSTFGEELAAHGVAAAVGFVALFFVGVAGHEGLQGEIGNSKFERGSWELEIRKAKLEFGMLLMKRGPGRHQGEGGSLIWWRPGRLPNIY
jgi:hypothetical protein